MKEPIYKNVFRCDSISAVDGFLSVRDVLKYEMFGDEGDKGFRNFEGVISNLEEIFNIKIKKSYFVPLSFEDLKSNEDARFAFVDKLIEFLIKECGIQKEYFNYGIWACDCPEDVVDSYNVSIEDVSKYKIKGVKLQDLGEEGSLYGCKNYPEEVLDESTTKLIMDFNQIFEKALLNESQALSDKNQNLDLIYKWLPFLADKKVEFEKLDNKISGKEVEVLFDCKSKGKTISFAENKELANAVRYRNEAFIIEKAMEEYKNILQDAKSVTLDNPDNNHIINEISKTTKSSFYLNYLFLMSMATSINLRAKGSSRSKIINNSNLKEIFLRGIHLENYESAESDWVLMGYLIFVLGNKLYTVLDGRNIVNKSGDFGGSYFDSSVDNPFSSILNAFKKHLFDDDPLFIPRYRKTIGNVGRGKNAGYHPLAVKLAQGEIDGDDIKESVSSDDELETIMKDYEKAKEFWTSQPCKEPFAVLYRCAMASLVNQEKAICRRSKKSLKQQQKAEDAFLAKNKLKRPCPFADVDEKLEMEEKYHDNVVALVNTIKSKTKHITDDITYWRKQYGLRRPDAEALGSMDLYNNPTFPPQFAAVIAGLLLNPDALYGTVVFDVLGVRLETVAMGNFGFKDPIVKSAFLYLQNNTAIKEYSEDSLKDFNSMIESLEHISGIKVPRDPIQVRFVADAPLPRKWIEYGGNVLSNIPLHLGSNQFKSWNQPVNQIKESNMNIDIDFEQLYQECVTAGGMGGCINNFVPQNVLTVTDTKLGAIAPGSARGKFVKDEKECDFENDTMKVHKKKAGKGDAITGTGIVYAKGKKMSESIDIEADDEDLGEHNYECCNCGVDCTDYGVMINGDLYCRDCAEHEIQGNDDIDDEPETSEETCPNCGDKYDLNNPESFGIAKGRLWCAKCAKKMKEKD